MELSHTVGVFVCVAADVVSQIFPVSVSVKCSVPNNASHQCFLEVTNFGMTQRCSSKDQQLHPVR